MKVHYINILLFALSLNILEHNQRKHKSTTPHTPKISTTRLLCECELYAPANYDNDPQMKEVMQQFEDRTSQRFHEYDDHMKTTRQKCKDKCDKEIQKIILKDKLEKQMEQQLTTLETKIDTDDIPTCVCEKSMADKVEKGCLRCGGILGVAMPELGAMGATALYTLSQWKPYALYAATKYALAKGVAKGAIAGKDAGMNVIIEVLTKKGIAKYCPQIFGQIQKIEHFTDLNNFADLIIAKYKGICAMTGAFNADKDAMCMDFGLKLGTRASINEYGIPETELVPQLLEFLSGKAKGTADFKAGEVSFATSSKIIAKQTTTINTTYTSWQTAINASAVAIVVIVLILVIIYLVLRYRRKKKMKKKLQYIKLLEE
ncbi:rifin [Plasmodium reichenowi]|uniref:Rifin n=1 Tax=Plasmodium reichenowi TaxID=5854 RepID=A0A060RM50_PLARE|nr:rifin [Plasmodium reichenowi]